MRSLIILGAALAWVSGGVQAATSLSNIRYATDITVTIGSVTAAPTDVIDDAMGTPALAIVGQPAAIAAYWYTGAVHWLVFDTTVALPGGITATPRDVIGYDGSAYTMVFDGAAAGVPAGAAIDAVAGAPGGNVLLSFDTTAAVSGLTVLPADVVRYDGTWNPFFDATAAGVPSGLNLDAVHLLSNGHVLLSFDGAGTLGGVSFGAGDVLEYSGGAIWELAYSPSAHYAGWGAANLRGLWANEVPVAANTPPIMGNIADQTGTVGVALVPIDVAAAVTLTDADPILSFALSGTLPPGLNFNTATGRIDGTPTAAGTYAISVTASDDDGVSNADTITFTIAAAPSGGTPPVMGNIADQTGTVGVPIASIDVAAVVTLTDADPVLSFAYAGTLPPGLTFNTATGRIDGTPTAAGSYTITVTASDDDGASNADTIAFVITASPSTPDDTVRSVPTLSGWRLWLLSMGLFLFARRMLPTRKSS